MIGRFLGVFSNHAIASRTDCRQLCAVGNTAHTPALTLHEGIRECREREEAHIFSATSLCALHSVQPSDASANVELRAEMWRNSAQACWQVGPIRSAVRLSRRSEGGPWHAS